MQPAVEMIHTTKQLCNIKNNKQHELYCHCHSLKTYTHAHTHIHSNNTNNNNILQQQNA